MRQFTKRRDIVRPGVTRFASGFLTLQSLAEKKSQLRSMFCSEEWEKCTFSKTVKGKTVYALVLNAAFWAGVTTCLKVFAPLVKVLRLVDADWKPSMGFIYGELKKARQEIKDALNDNENAYKPVLDIIAKKSSNRLDTYLHMTAYILNPFYYYHDPLAKLDVEANDSIVEILGILFPEDYDLQDHINTVELPMYKKLQKFDRPIATKSCAVNNEKFDPSYGGSAPNLRKIATRILSLTTSSSGCERIWSIFEGVHTKKRNRLEVAKMNNLVYVQANANLMEHNKKRMARNHEILLGEDASEAQEWIVDGDDAHWEAIGDALGVEDE
ncbi:pescadillo-like protein [Tanacetum coccineum]|uniref:Pescadillo-like protein n=1 Tax=Tanacetum coccineum TaxID=301880 RepID=A0ABQ5ARS1_9ASTR